MILDHKEEPKDDLKVLNILLIVFIICFIAFMVLSGCSEQTQETLTYRR